MDKKLTALTILLLVITSFLIFAAYEYYVCAERIENENNRIYFKARDKVILLSDTIESILIFAGNFSDDVLRVYLFQASECAEDLRFIYSFLYSRTGDTTHYTMSTASSNLASYFTSLLNKEPHTLRNTLNGDLQTLKEISKILEETMYVSNYRNLSSEQVDKLLELTELLS